MPRTLHQLLSGDLWQGYAYAYPHKMAYRHFPAAIPLTELWAAEDRRALFLYLHVPFCEMRCGFCNLFTTANPNQNYVTRYLDAIERNIEAVGSALGTHCFARGAIGGGTPTFLSVGELDRIFAASRRCLTIPDGMLLSCELSPATAEPEKILYLREQGVTRISIGVQSFLEAETKALGRPQKSATLHAALKRMRDADFPVMNVDLIYGAAGQTAATWRESLIAAISYAPEEIFLYPLYVRPLTGLDRLGRDPSDIRLELYRAGRDFLLGRGYRQVSQRLFRHESCPGGSGAEYCCQEDGMAGIGPGARSYTREVHYCTEYAVGRSGITAILEDYNTRTLDDHAHAVYGTMLNGEEQRRRFIIKSLLRCDGLNLMAYRERFGTDSGGDFPMLDELAACGLASDKNGALQLTESGFERADVIGPWFYSEAVRTAMEEYSLT